MAALKLLCCLAFIAVVSAKGKYRCNGIDNGCCTKAKPCYEGDGDCDYDSHCGKGLVCGLNNCAWGGGGDDCCVRKGLRCKGIDNGCCTAKKPCAEGDGDCDSDKECLPGLTCHNGLNNCAWGGNGDDCCVRKGMRCFGIDNGCCTKAKPCVEGDGDCDWDNHCANGLVCGLNNCVWGGNGDDCCIKAPPAKHYRTNRCDGIDNGCCTKAKPCYEGDGDCDNDAECGKGLVCHNGLNNCAWGGNGDDCCERKGLRCRGIDNGCCTAKKPCAEGDGDCDSDKECLPGLTCHNGLNNCAWGGNGDDCCVRKGMRCFGIDNGCCTKAKPCVEGDGDCDSNAECGPGLMCANDLNNCAWGGNGDDCCIKAPPGLRCKGIDNGCCTKKTPCGLNDGDCDYDSECLPGLKCGLNNCVWGGYGDDCCIRKPGAKVAVTKTVKLSKPVYKTYTKTVKLSKPVYKTYTTTVKLSKPVYKTYTTTRKVYKTYSVVKGDEPKADEPQADEPQADEPQADEPQADEPQAEESEDDVQEDEQEDQ